MNENVIKNESHSLVQKNKVVIISFIIIHSIMTGLFLYGSFVSVDQKKWATFNIFQWRIFEICIIFSLICPFFLKCHLKNKFLIFFFMMIFLFGEMTILTLFDFFRNGFQGIM